MPWRQGIDTQSTPTDLCYSCMCTWMHALVCVGRLKELKCNARYTAVLVEIWQQECGVLTVTGSPKVKSLYCSMHVSAGMCFKLGSCAWERVELPTAQSNDVGMLLSRAWGTAGFNEALLPANMGCNACKVCSTSDSKLCMYLALSTFFLRASSNPFAELLLEYKAS